MCRHLAYVGPSIAVSEPLLDASHALVRQAQNPQFQLSGDDNPDGFGVVWYEAGTPHPWRYRTTMPMWLQPGLAGAFVGVHAHALVAAARLASPGLPIDVANNAPFVSGHWSFSLNGQIENFTNGIGDTLRAGLSARRHDGIEGAADSEVLFAMTLDRLDAGAPLAAALVDAIHAVEAVTSGRLNCVLNDGHRVVATAVGNSLFARTNWVSSEPIDDHPEWVRVPDRSVVSLAPGEAPTVEPM
jgi:glutamine amidotransferase